MPSSCILSPLKTTRKGYALMCKWKQPAIGAHRFAYTKAYGPIPDGMHVLHHCDVRNCINPEHLFLGTNADNIADKCRKDRSGKKLTIEKVRKMKALRKTGMTHAAIAEIFDINQSNVSRALSGQRWAHVFAEREV